MDEKKLSETGKNLITSGCATLLLPVFIILFVIFVMLVLSSGGD